MASKKLSNALYLQILFMLLKMTFMCQNQIQYFDLILFGPKIPNIWYNYVWNLERVSNIMLKEKKNLFQKLSHRISLDIQDMSLFMRKSTFCVGKNKGADQLPSNREAGQRLCFHYMDSTLQVLYFLEIQNFQPISSL